MFSDRLPGLEPNALTRAVARARASGTRFYDLTETNPTAVGLTYPALSDVLSGPGVASYRPHALGHPDARARVAATFAARGADVPASRCVLTASTSEAYSFLFKLLCEPGDQVLVPQPSYPLFELLTRLDAVTSAPYRLDAGGAWCLDRVTLDQAATDRTRAVLIVSPNNPTGSMLRADDREWLVGFAARRRLALIADEVFFDYQFSPPPDVVSLAGEARVLTFTLGGLSKSAGLPQMKLAWIGVSGPDADVEEAMGRLEVIADTYLSVSTAVQLNTDLLISVGNGIRAAIATRLERNLDALTAWGRAHPAVGLTVPDGGWSVVVRVPAILSEEQLVLRLLEEDEVLVHPGYFFDFDHEAYVVCSLLPSPDTFDEGLARIGRRLEC
ncbi:MAG: pyridoxal phosphate-dependent aminotransferase [Acidobacteriota bacterium]